LDLTIDALGRKRVENEIEKLKMMQRLVKDHCEATTIFRCTQEGSPNKLAEQNCRFGDVGCGHECAQQTLK